MLLLGGPTVAVFLPLRDSLLDVALLLSQVSLSRTISSNSQTRLGFQVGAKDLPCPNIGLGQLMWVHLQLPASFRRSGHLSNNAFLRFGGNCFSCVLRLHHPCHPCHREGYHPCHGTTQEVTPRSPRRSPPSSPEAHHPPPQLLARCIGARAS